MTKHVDGFETLGEIISEHGGIEGMIAYLQSPAYEEAKRVRRELVNRRKREIEHRYDDGYKFPDEDER
jgi:hypothetical protein